MLVKNLRFNTSSKSLKHSMNSRSLRCSMSNRSQRLSSSNNNLKSNTCQKLKLTLRKKNLRQVSLCSTQIQISWLRLMLTLESTTRLWETNRLSLLQTTTMLTFSLLLLEKKKMGSKKGNKTCQRLSTWLKKRSLQP